jgi:hypothetical protein
MQSASTPPNRNPLSSNSFPELFAGSTTAFDEIPSHASTQQAPPTPAAQRRVQPPPSLAASPVDSSSSSPSSPTPTPPLAQRTAHFSTEIAINLGQAKVEDGVKGGTRTRQNTQTGQLGKVGLATPVQSTTKKPKRLVLERFSLYETRTVSRNLLVSRSKLSLTPSS